MTANSRPKRVVYLFGAGATHACIQRVGSPHGLLMRHLNDPLATRVSQLIQEKYPNRPNLHELVNTVVDEETDIEQVITFLDNAPSMLHREFAEDLRHVFEDVLRNRLRAVRQDDNRNPIDLYTALFDLHTLLGSSETIQGILTTNYDSYIEEALLAAGYGSADLGFHVDAANSDSSAEPVKLLKLHGSFDWQDTWPITTGGGGETLWIPPGIQKDKQRYPFAVIWGLAREVLSCDVLRIIGCRLGGNDWDLISLLFTSIHVQAPYKRYTVEVVDSPKAVMHLGDALPYLEPCSILDLEDIGRQLVSESSGGPPRDFGDLEADAQENVLEGFGPHANWFEIWLRQKAELAYRELGTLSTAVGAIERFLEE